MARTTGIDEFTQDAPRQDGLLDCDIDICQYQRMVTKRVTANLPEELLEEAMAVTGTGITETLVEGLKRVRHAGALSKALALKGKLQLEIDLGESRERHRGRHLGVD